MKKKTETVIIQNISKPRLQVKQYKILNKSISAYKELEKELNECLRDGFQIETIDEVHLNDTTEGNGYIVWLYRYVDEGSD